MARPPSADSILRNEKKQRQSFEPKTPIATDMFLPNQSGDHSAGHTGTPVKDIDIANKKYIDDKNVESFPTIFTAGSIPFSDGSNLTQDNSNLFWDDTNKRLGIGTNIPSSVVNIVATGSNAITRLINPTDTSSVGLHLGESDISGTTFQKFGSAHASLPDFLWITSPGDVSWWNVDNFGIGILAPTTQLDVVKNHNAATVIRVHNPNDSGTSAQAAFKVQADSSVANYIAHGSGRTGSRYGVVFGDTVELLASGANALLIGHGTADKPIIFGANNVQIMRLESGNADFPAGRISSNHLNVTASSDNLNVANVNTLFINITGDIILGGLTGGVAGQTLNIVLVGNFTNHVEIEHATGRGDQDFINHLSVDEFMDHGGAIYICNGSDWYDASHSRHV